MEIEVLRIGQRLVRDDRVTTHVALVSRAFGASKIYMNEVNPEIKDTLEKINNTWGGDFDITVRLLNTKVIDEKDIRFFLGYSGWASLQLDQELLSKSWIVVQNEHESDIIQKTSNAFWREKMLELGGEYLLWSNAPENPGLN